MRNCDCDNHSCGSGQSYVTAAAGKVNTAAACGRVSCQLCGESLGVDLCRFVSAAALAEFRVVISLGVSCCLHQLWWSLLVSLGALLCLLWFGSSGGVSWFVLVSFRVSWCLAALVESLGVSWCLFVSLSVWQLWWSLLVSLCVFSCLLMFGSSGGVSGVS